MSCRDDAVRLLQHYVTTTMKAAGLKVDSDTRAELEECVDQIINASVEKTMQRINDGLRAGKFGGQL